MKPCIQWFFLLGMLVLISGNVYAQSEKKISHRFTINQSAWLGVEVKDVDELIAKKEKLRNDEGAYITKVIEDSPADSAGIKKHDVIVELNGKSVDDANSLVQAVRKSTPGKKVSCRLFRDGKQVTLDVQIGKRENAVHKEFHFDMPTIPNSMWSNNRILGLTVIELSEQLADYFHAPDHDGVLVEEVQKQSKAEKAGLKAGDVILRVGRRSVHYIEDIRRELRKYEENDTIEIEVLRNGERKIFEVELIPTNDDYHFNHVNPQFQFFQTDPLYELNRDEVQNECIKPNTRLMRQNIEHMIDQINDMRLDCNSGF